MALGASVLVPLLCFPPPPLQTTGRANPPLVIASMYGRDLFMFYCASCHGRDGRGGGPVAPSLRVAVPDLTTMAARHGGVFPTTRVASFVTGTQERAAPAHGSKEMPVWGPIFQALDPADRSNTIRIANVVAYIESLQVRK